MWENKKQICKHIYKVGVLFNFLKIPIALAGVAHWIEHWPSNQSRWFNSQSGHMPGLWARSPVGGA